MADALIPLDESISVSGASSGASGTSGDSSFVAPSRSKSRSSSGSGDSVHSSDHLVESEPSDGIPLAQLGTNPLAIEFEKDAELVKFQCVGALVRAFFAATERGFVGASRDDDGVLTLTGPQPQPEGLWDGPEAVLGNSKLVEEFMETVGTTIGLFFVDADFAEEKSRKKDNKSIRRLYNGKAATAHRMELAKKRGDAKREAKLEKDRKKKEEEVIV
jgi:hypothetical protein